MQTATTKPVRKPRQKRAIRTRAALLAAAEKTFSSKGYAATTTAAIAQAAGVATGTFYQYFADKDALLREIASERSLFVADRTLDPLETDLRAGGLAALVERHMRTLVGLVMKHHRDDPGLHAVLTERRHCDEALDALTSEAERSILLRVAGLLERWNHPGDQVATAFVLFGMVEGSVHTHVLGTSVVDDDRFVDALVDAMLRVALPHNNAQQR
jgi:AcrR family transcriptional regulator